MEAGPARPHGRGGGPRRECRQQGRGFFGPAPRAGSQWTRRRRVTEGAEVRVPRRRRRGRPCRSARVSERGRGGAGARSRGPRTPEAARPGPPEERERPGGGAMPLAQLKEPWPLMELVPLDPEVSEPGGEPAPAADDPGSPQRRGSSWCFCSVAGAREGASALRSLAPSSAPPPLPRVCVREGQFRRAPERGSGGRRALASLTPHT